MADPFHLERFVEAQADVYGEVVSELRDGKKRSHWMWFIFPQIQGLGSSPTAVHYAISSLQEAAAYLAHPVLGHRLVECTQFMLAVEERSVHEIFGSPDDLKFHSSMTLFANVDSKTDTIFHRALQKYFNGQQDTQTTSRVSR